MKKSNAKHCQPDDVRQEVNSDRHQFPGFARLKSASTFLSENKCQNVALLLMPQHTYQRHFLVKSIAVSKKLLHPFRAAFKHLLFGINQWRLSQLVRHVDLFKKTNKKNGKPIKVNLFAAIPRSCLIVTNGNSTLIKYKSSCTDMFSTGYIN